MNQSNLRRATAYTLILLQALWLAGCGKPAPAEEAIAAAISDMASALEQREASPIVARLHDDLIIREGIHGALGKEQAGRMLTATFFRHKNISVVLTNIEVTPDSIRDDRASARFNALVTGGSGGMLPDRAQLYRISSEWQLADDWQLIALEAKRALE
jgi:hypothetical protein